MSIKQKRTKEATIAFAIEFHYNLKFSHENSVLIARDVDDESSFNHFPDHVLKTGPRFLRFESIAISYAGKKSTGETVAKCQSLLAQVGSKLTAAILIINGVYLHRNDPLAFDLDTLLDHIVSHLLPYFKDCRRFGFSLNCYKYFPATEQINIIASILQLEPINLSSSIFIKMRNSCFFPAKLPAETIGNWLFSGGTTVKNQREKLLRVCLDSGIRKASSVEMVEHLKKV